MASFEVQELVNKIVQEVGAYPYENYTYKVELSNNLSQIHDLFMEVQTVMEKDHPNIDITIFGRSKRGKDIFYLKAIDKDYFHLRQIKKQERTFYF